MKPTKEAMEKAMSILIQDMNVHGSIDSIKDLERAIAIAITEAVEAEREGCCQIIFGQCGSDNVAQRMVDNIRSKKRMKS